MKMPQTNINCFSKKLFHAIKSPLNIAIVTHNNPDPDAIASGWALRFLIKKRCNRMAKFLAGGGIIRAENRQMVSLLNPPIKLTQQPRINSQTAIILVDCGANSRNHIATEYPKQIVGVIDHHERENIQSTLGFQDIRPNAASTASIVTSYLRENNLEPDSKMATGLLYAIETEVSGGDTLLTKLDHAMIDWLTQYANHNLLGKIRNAPLPLKYYSDVNSALEKAVVYDRSVFCFLPQISGPETVGEMADMLVRCENILSVCCIAFYANNLFVSVRTDIDGDNAADLVSQTVATMGHCGGHQHRAGGVISLDTFGKLCLKNLETQLRNRWLKACRTEGNSGVRLVKGGEGKLE